MTVLRSIALCTVAGLALSGVSAQPSESEYVFDRFVGVWKLKDDKFQQVWDGKTVETLSIPEHRTHCAKVNTDRSILCEVDAGGFQGHILWAIDLPSREVSHLSHFGSSRLGHGVGQLRDNGDLQLRIRFSDEPVGTYRVYEYQWVDEGEYRMISRQYDIDGQPTGNWYGGSFERTDEDG